MNIVQIPNNNFFPSREGYKARWVILHGTAGGTSAQAIASFFKSTQGGNNPVSSHYVIGQDGTIVECVSEADGAYANGVLSAGHDSWWSDAINPNDLTISIEHCKPSNDNSDALTPAQESSSFALIADICKRNGIPARTADASGGITGHYSLDPVNRSRCPGAYNWDKLWAYLKGGLTMGVPTGWKDANGVLTAPNNIPVVMGFRDYILNNTWDATDWPLEPEHGQNPLEKSNPGLGNGSQQVFRYSMLGYTPDRGVFREWIGQELLALRGAQTPPVTGIADTVNALKSIVTIAQTTISKLSS